MSILEIMIAAVILFIVLTGVLGLVGQTTLMGVSAKQKNVMVNALNAYVERVQSLPFTSVGIVSVDESGTLPAEETTTVGEFTVVIRPSVSDGANDALKRLTVGITVSAPGRAPTSMTTTIPIRDRTQYMTQANRTPETDPVVEFNDSYTPAEGALVWDQNCSSGVLQLAVTATASEGRTLQNVALWVDDTYLLRDPYQVQATWNPSADSFSQTVVWNTRQTEDIYIDEFTYEPTEVISDGMRTVSAYALDDNNVSVFTVRHFLVDNHAPGMPGRPGGVASSNTNATVSWDIASDGTTPADHYQVRMFKQPIDDSGPMNPYEHWPEVTAGTPSGASLAFSGGTSFSRYYPAVRALSPRSLASAYTTSTATSAVPFVTRPLITGTYIAEKKSTGNPKYWRITSTLSCTVPTFATTGTKTYTWYRTVAGSTTQVQTGAANTLVSNVYQLDGNPAATAPAVQYYCVATYTAAGVGATGVAETIQSNTVTVATSAAGTFTFTEGSW